MTTKRAAAKQEAIAVERIAASIYLIKGQKAMIDADLAAMYGVDTKVFNQAVQRNRDRFPEDFMFQLTSKEAETLRSQIVTSKRGGRRYAPYVFTEHGVAMLSSVLRSKRAVEVNIAIIGTFIKLRRILASNEDLTRMVAKHDRQISVLFEHVQKMLAPVPVKKNSIGFAPPAN